MKQLATVSKFDQKIIHSGKTYFWINGMWTNKIFEIENLFWRLRWKRLEDEKLKSDRTFILMKEFYYLHLMLNTIYAHGSLAMQIDWMTINLTDVYSFNKMTVYYCQRVTTKGWDLLFAHTISQDDIYELIFFSYFVVWIIIK